MSRENLEVLGRLNEAFNRGDINSGLRFMDPEIELYPGIEVPDEEDLYAGHGGIEEWFRGATEAWETISVEHLELVELVLRINGFLSKTDALEAAGLEPGAGPSRGGS